MVFGQKSNLYSEITVTLVWTSGAKKGNSSFNKCIFFKQYDIFPSASPSACQETSFREREKKSTEKAQSTRTQQVPPAFCPALKVQRKHKAMKKQGLTVQLFIPEFKTTTWGKRLAEEVSWRVAGSRRAGSLRDISLSPNQLNKSLHASDWAADYGDSSRVSEHSWSGSCFSEPTKRSLACSHWWEGNMSWRDRCWRGRESGAGEGEGNQGLLRWEGLKVLSQHYWLRLPLHEGDTYSSQAGIWLTHLSLQIVLK